MLHLIQYPCYYICKKQRKFHTRVGIDPVFSILIPIRSHSAKVRDPVGIEKSRFFTEKTRLIYYPESAGIQPNFRPKSNSVSYDAISLKSTQSSKLSFYSFENLRPFVKLNRQLYPSISEIYNFKIHSLIVSERCDIVKLTC